MPRSDGLPWVSELGTGYCGSPGRRSGHTVERRGQPDCALPETGPGTYDSWWIMTALWVVVVVQGAVLTVLAALYIGILRRLIPTMEKAESLVTAGGALGLDEPKSVGHQLPDFEVLDEKGDVRKSALIFDRVSIVLFLSGHCEPCRGLAAQIKNSEWKGQNRLVVILTDPPGDSSVDVGGACLVLRQTSDGAASKAFGTNITPIAFLVEEGGHVETWGIPGGLDDLMVIGRHSPRAERLGVGAR